MEIKSNAIKLFFCLIISVIVFVLIFSQLSYLRSEKQYFYLKTANNHFQHEVTVVSTYFYINKSKHSHQEYKKWIENFLLSVSSPLIIFTDNKSLDKELLDLRKALQVTIYYVNSHWDILNDIENKRNKKYIDSYKYIQNSLDPEKNIHSPDLYLIWNTKSYLMNLIAQENPHNSKIFIYTDSGAWRDQRMYNWPNVSFVKEIANLIQDKILFGQISDFNLNSKNKNFPYIGIIQGGFFMGSKKALYDFYNEFWFIHDTFLDQGKFVGKDQHIMNMVAYNSSITNSVAKLRTWNIGCNTNAWFFYQNYFASNEYYSCVKPKEKLIILK